MSDVIRFTPTQQDILDLMADGQMHTKQEIKERMADPDTNDKNVYRHIRDIRRKLHMVGQDIKCVVNNHRFYYQQVQLLRAPSPVVDED